MGYVHFPSLPSSSPLSSLHPLNTVDVGLEKGILSPGGEGGNFTDRGGEKAIGINTV